MNYLITGGAGFIGGHLTETLIRSGHSVSIIDDLSTGSLDNLKRVKDNSSVTFVQGDVTNCPELEPMIRKADCVFHLAAAVGVELVVHDPIRTIMTNVLGSERVLSICAELKKRCIVASTSEVYGKSTKLPFKETDDLLIGPSTHSRWSYACSKLLDEFLLMAYSRNKNLPGTVVRFFNTVGPRQTGRYGMVIPRFVNAALNGKDIEVYGSGQQTRCFCHVFDTIRALLAIVDNPVTCGQIYNIGSTTPITIEALAERIIALTGSSSKIKRIPYDQAYEVGFEDMLHRAPDCSKIGTLCGWKAEISLDKIIQDVADDIRSR